MPSNNKIQGRGGGPKTQAGRVRSAQNARRHGLSLNIAGLEQYTAERERLALSITGANTDENSIEVAQQIADAELDLRRVQSVRQELFTELEATVGATSHGIGLKPTRRELRLLEKIRILEERKQPLKNQEALINRLTSELDRLKASLDAPRLRGAGASVLDRLIRIERYERRALSRRSKAINKLLEISNDCKN